MKPTQKSTTTVIADDGDDDPEDDAAGGDDGGADGLVVDRADDGVDRVEGTLGQHVGDVVLGHGVRLPGGPGRPGRHDVADPDRVGPGVGADDRARGRRAGAGARWRCRSGGPARRGSRRRRRRPRRCARAGRPPPPWRSGRPGPRARVRCLDSSATSPSLSWITGLMFNREPSRARAPADAPAALEELEAAQHAVDAGAGDAVLGGGHELVDPGAGGGLLGRRDHEQALAHGEREGVDDAARAPR